MAASEVNDGRREWVGPVRFVVAPIIVGVACVGADRLFFRGGSQQPFQALKPIDDAQPHGDVASEHRTKDARGSTKAPVDAPQPAPDFGVELPPQVARAFRDARLGGQLVGHIDGGWKFAPYALTRRPVDDDGFVWDVEPDRVRRLGPSKRH